MHDHDGAPRGQLVERLAAPLVKQGAPEGVPVGDPLLLGVRGVHPVDRALERLRENGVKATLEIPGQVPRNRSELESAG